ncbi:MAG TPA: hypothetical protein VNO32_36865 [Candidatus Acidoferrum sp.]|jgi:hypothetical protein|nr:hypothetical protein [Candidatus Acidoferrum sp.]
MDDKRWRVLYRTTVLESEKEKLQTYVMAAEDAINGRTVALNGNIPRDERVALGNALSALRGLKRGRARRTAVESEHHHDAGGSK